MKEKITLLPFGTKVEFGDPKQAEFVGKIEAARVSRYTIMYEIRYWSKNELLTIILPEDELSILDKSGEEKVIGFKAMTD